MVTDRELEILKVLWVRGKASVREVQEDLNKQAGPVAYSTVQTLLNIMEEKKGLVRHSVEGRTFIYTPKKSSDRTIRDLTRRFVDRVFDGALDRVMVALLDSKPPSAEEFDRLRAMIDEAQKQSGDRPEGEAAAGRGVNSGDRPVFDATSSTLFAEGEGWGRGSTGSPCSGSTRRRRRGASIWCVVTLMMVACHQPARRSALARGAILGSLALPASDGLGAGRSDRGDQAPRPVRAAGPAIGVRSRGRARRRVPDGTSSRGFCVAAYAVGRPGGVLDRLALGYWGSGGSCRRSEPLGGEPSPPRRVALRRVGDARGSGSRIGSASRRSSGLIRPTILIPPDLDRPARGRGRSGSASCTSWPTPSRLDPWFGLLGGAGPRPLVLPAADLVAAGPDAARPGIPRRRRRRVRLRIVGALRLVAGRASPTRGRSGRGPVKPPAPRPSRRRLGALPAGPDARPLPVPDGAEAAAMVAGVDDPRAHDPDDRLLGDHPATVPPPNLAGAFSGPHTFRVSSLVIDPATPGGPVYAAQPPVAAPAHSST